MNASDPPGNPYASPESIDQPPPAPRIDGIAASIPWWCISLTVCIGLIAVIVTVCGLAAALDAAFGGGDKQLDRRLTGTERAVYFLSSASILVAGLCGLATARYLLAADWASFGRWLAVATVIACAAVGLVQVCCPVLWFR